MPTTMPWVARGLLAGPSWARLAGDKGRGAAHLHPPEAFLSHFLTPTPPPRHAFSGSRLQPFPFPASFHPLLFTNLPLADINECEEDGIECGPGQMCFNTRGSYQCVDTPCPATYRRGSSPG